jgi:general secretion pathway protein G
MRTYLSNRSGFTLIEIVIAVAIVAIFAAAISPMVFRHLEDAKVGKAQNEAETIATAVLNYY